MELFKWAFLWLPLIVAVPSVAGTQQHFLVLRDDTISPVLGMPRSLVYVSCVLTPIYIFAAFKFCKAQILASLGQASALLLLSAIFAPISVMATGYALNDHLDVSPIEAHQAEILELSRVKVTPYIKVTDWKNPNGYVLLRGGKSFLQEHPVGSTIKITTKRGLFRYEYIISVS